MDVVIRLAVAADIGPLNELIGVSVRALQAGDYTRDQIQAALARAYGVDSQLVADATYFVAQTVDGARPVGCGGWSRRTKLHGGDAWDHGEHALLDPRTDAAKIRAFFVHPDWARRGIASRILAASEDAARAAGFRRFEIGATLTGAPLYAARGYRTTGRTGIDLGAGVRLPIVLMRKDDPSGLDAHDIFNVLPPGSD